MGRMVCAREPSRCRAFLAPGNVLFHPDLPPAIIDLSPYWRPALFATAIVVIDAMIWEGADRSALSVIDGRSGAYQYLLRLPAARGHDHRPVHLRAPLRYPGPRDQRRGKLHRHSLSLSVTLPTDETSRQAVIRSGVTGLLEAREPSAEVLRRASTRRDTSTSCWSWRAICGRCGYSLRERRCIKIRSVDCPLGLVPRPATFAPFLGGRCGCGRR